MQAAAVPDAEQNVVGLKPPVFWAEQLQVWFAHVEAQFHLLNIVVDDTRYFHVIRALTQETASRLLPVLEDPPALAKYQASFARSG